MLKPGDLVEYDGKIYTVTRQVGDQVETSHGTFPRCSVFPTAVRTKPLNIDPDEIVFDRASDRRRLKKAKFELNGHWKSGELLEHREHLEFHLRSPLPNDGTFVRVSVYGAKCPYCENVVFETDGDTIRTTTACPNPNGLPPTVWEINVPSGKLVVANDLRSYFPDTIDNSGAPLGNQKTTLFYATHNLAHAFVGNSCPSVYRENDTYVIGRRTSQPLAHITTDVWCYSICDYDELARRDTQAVSEVFDVEPGIYQFTAVESEAGPEPETFATFKRIGDAKELTPIEPPKPPHPAALVRAFAFRWPTLIGVDSLVPWHQMSEEQQLDAWLETANLIFHTSGSIEWRNGSPAVHVHPSFDSTEVSAVPHFRFAYPWHGHTNTPLYHGELTPPYAEFAFRILESILTFGRPTLRKLEPHDKESYLASLFTPDPDLTADSHYAHVPTPISPHKFDRASKRYLELAALHPTLADPQYVQWLSTPTS